MNCGIFLHICVKDQIVIAFSYILNIKIFQNQWLPNSNHPLYLGGLTVTELENQESPAFTTLMIQATATEYYNVVKKREPVKEKEYMNVEEATQVRRTKF